MKTNNDVGRRCYEAFRKYYGTVGKARKAEGFGRNTMSQWLNGTTPRVEVLYRAYELGMDVMWILTGEGEER